MLPSEDPDDAEYHSVLTSIGEAGLWNEKGRIAAHIDRLTEASREVRTEDCSSIFKFDQSKLAKGQGLPRRRQKRRPFSFGTSKFEICILT